MDRSRFSRIAHSFLPVAAPIDRAQLHGLLKLLPLDPDSTVLDVGCGRAALLVDILAERDVRGTGVDRAAEVLRIARTTAQARGCADRLTLVEASALELVFDSPFDLTLCVGASHAVGGPVAALDHLARWTRVGGYALWGEGFWRRDPDPAYLAAIGSSKHDLSTHYDNAAAAHERGWSVIWSAVTSDSCWDRYEGLYRMTS
jgi:ubiquinone/menaquinone biosynthesis C-methylase UbiE